MGLPDSRGPGSGPLGTHVPPGPRAFVPMMFHDELGWVAITPPQGAARSACLAVTAHIHLMDPCLPLRDLDARAQDAIRALEDGADSVDVTDDRHRVVCADAAR